MADFNFITPRLATGGALGSVADANAIAVAGITHIIDCRSEFDDSSLLATLHPSIAYLWNGTEDDGQQKPLEWFSTSLAFGMAALSQPHNKVLAHCAAGMNRGPSTAYLLMRACGFTPEDARAMIIAARPACSGGLAYTLQADHAVEALGYA